MQKEDKPMDTSDETIPTMNIVETAQSNPDFSTLVDAVVAAGLVDTLSGEGPFTVLAPTNAAFAKLPEGTLENLLANPDQLTEILTYHVIPGKAMAADVVKLNTAQTVEGSSVDITVTNGKVMINDATVVTTDIETTNGVIHVIDTVLLP
ncbi:MAG: fasciclin domain-containing protein [Pseudomonadales bacterium]|nr:fasciclin domain-containing protein [Pseudomonadales bacterium]